MGLKTRISKADFDSLNDILKTEYIPDGDGYKLDADYEDVTGLKSKRDELLAELAKAKSQMKAFDGLDPEAARKALVAAQAAEDDKLKAAGEFEKLREQLEARHKAEVEKAVAERNTILSNLKREKLANVLTEKGVLPDRVKYLLGELDPQIELAATENGFQLKKIGGIGDAAEFEQIIASVKESSPFFFANDLTPGSGASGSGNGNGGGGVKTISEAQYDAMSPKEQAAFVTSGGKITD